MADSRAIQILLRQIAEAIVDSPEEIRIECVTRDKNDQFRLHVAPTDIGKVVGKQGRHARAIRELLSGASLASDRRFTLDIVESGLRDSR